MHVRTERSHAGADAVSTTYRCACVGRTRTVYVTWRTRFDHNCMPYTPSKAMCMKENYKHMTAAHRNFLLV